MPASGFVIQARVLLLLNNNLHPMLHAGDCFVGVFLAGC